MTSGRKNDPAGSLWKRWDQFRAGALSGPQAGFLCATLIGFGAGGFSRATLPPDVVMPIVATIFLLLAAALAFFAWCRPPLDPSQVTYFDAAGALMLIGCFAATTIDPDQLVRLVESRTEN